MEFLNGIFHEGGRGGEGGMGVPLKGFSNYFA